MTFEVHVAIIYIDLLIMQCEYISSEDTIQQVVHTTFIYLSELESFRLH